MSVWINECVIQEENNMLINFTNHPSEKWTADQKNSAIRLYGGVRDLPFPAVPANAGTPEIIAMAEGAIDKILAIKEENIDTETFAVMVQGEFTLTYAVVRRLLDRKIKAVSAVSERNVIEQVENGEVRKTIVFRFGGFREYA